MFSFYFQRKDFLKDADDGAVTALSRVFSLIDKMKNNEVKNQIFPFLKYFFDEKNKQTIMRSSYHSDP